MMRRMRSLLGVYIICTFLFVHVAYNRMKINKHKQDSFTAIHLELEPVIETLPLSNSTGVISDNYTANIPHKPEIHAVLLFRLWGGDAFGMNLTHLSHWISYMKDMCGVQEVHSYENCHSAAECTGVGKPWPEVDYFQAQYTAYVDAMNSMPNKDIWMLQMDLDEFPFMPGDTKPGFLQRFISSLDADVTQVLLPCVFFGGKPENNDDRLPVQFTHRMPEPEHGRMKPLFRLDAAESMRFREVHGMTMRQGRTIVADAKELRMNHYWGDRMAAGSVRDTGLRDWLLHGRASSL